MNTLPRTSRRRGFRALFAGLGAALQWRLLLLWLLATLVPALLATYPVWSGLQGVFGYTPFAADIAAGDNTPLLIQGLMKLGEQFSALGASTLGAVLLMCLLSPFLAGMVVASLRAGRRLGFVELIAGGAAQYWRMLRMLLWSLIPLGIALAIGGGIMGAADKATEHAVLASEVAKAAKIAMICAAIVFVVLHTTVEAGRGWLGADGSLRSVIRAWWRGFKLVLRRPIASLGVYLGSLIVALLFATLFAWLRLKVDGNGTGAMLLAFLLAQATALALAWGKVARLYGLADLAADAKARRG